MDTELAELMFYLSMTIDHLSIPNAHFSSNKKMFDKIVEQTSVILELFSRYDRKGLGKKEIGESVKKLKKIVNEYRYEVAYFCPVEYSEKFDKYDEYRRVCNALIVGLGM